MKVSVIIVSYNVKSLLKNCIQSLYKFWPSTISFEIIVIDNNSQDGSQEMVAEEFKNAILITSPSNLGFSIANNVAAKQASGDALLLLNPDTELFDYSISKLLDDYFSNLDMKIIAPRLINSDGSIQRSLIKFPGVWQMFGELFYLAKIFDNFNIKAERINVESEVEALSGAVLLIDKKYFFNLGMLDVNLFWMEDVDLCLKNKLSGGKNIYFPETKILHHSGKSSAKKYKMVIANQLLSKIKFIYKYSNTVSKLAILLVCNLHMLIRIIVFLILSIFKRSFFMKAIAYIHCIAIVNGKVFRKDLSIYIQ